MRQPMDVLHNNTHESFSLNEEGAMVVSSDGVDFSSSLSIDKKRADSYLILALVDQLSSYIEPNEPSKPAKFLLGHLVRRKLIPEHMALDFEMDITGNRKAFKVLISQLTGEMSDHFSRSDSNALLRYHNTQKQNTRNEANNIGSIPKKVLLDVTPNIPRFRLDFKVIQTLGKGGFGQVYKAQHNVDGKIYAIKRVSMKDKKPACSAVREVKILANLVHPNIVRYHNCWLEADFPRKRRIHNQKLRELKNNSRSSDRSNPQDSFSMSSYSNSTVDNDDLEIVFEHSIGNSRIEDNQKAIPYSDKSEPVYSSSFPESNSLSSHFSKPMAQVEPYRQPQCGLILNIQMQCCDTDLAQKLRKRSEISVPENLKLMRDLLAGLEYLHANNIIHRDIKPSNLFLDKDSLQIGDVGLARYNLLDAEGCGFTNPRQNGLSEDEHWNSLLFADDLTRSVGTFLYAAPEMSGNSKIYHCSSDIFSCGIVMFELFNMFGTNMERIENLQAIRKGEVPPDFERDYPEAAEMVFFMTSTDPNNRPTASDLLRHPFFSKQGEKTMEQAELVIKQLGAQLEKVKKRLETERSISRQLRLQLSDFRTKCTCNASRGNIEEIFNKIEDVR
ncbi:eukaryotic translation initiation factor 2-alpha kinase-like [Bolinopsis microptera]|uniref:eukaryotic translation initiation factor 2-alpha kinase-like n=1 Tax=Bolinopsis microptera TaxID=2820187 RepID=UPI003078CFB0